MQKLRLSRIIRYTSLIGILLLCTISANAYAIRESAPRAGTAGWEYYSDWNPYNSYGTGNCTWYAFGRAYEVLGSRPNIGMADAKDWYANSQYPKGPVAQPGSIACWDIGLHGHVQFVESVNSDGTITFTESSYGGPYWNKDNIPTPVVGKGKFLGYIYLVGSPDSTSPTIEDVYYYDVDETGYTVHCIVRDDSALKSIQFSTWTPWINGQDDLVTNTYPLSGKSWEFHERIKTSDHNGDTNCEYVTDIKINDAYGNSTTNRVSLFLRAVQPTIEDAYAYDVRADGYSIHCIVKGNELRSVKIATWTPWIDGQDDLTWNTYDVGGTSWEINHPVNIADHKYNSNCEYVTDVYVTDLSGSVTTQRITVFVGNVNVEVTGIVLNSSSLSLAVGNSETLAAAVSPSNATDKTVTWTSSNNLVAQVSNGTVSAISAGVAVITATAGNQTATCEVTVRANTHTVSFSANGGGGLIDSRTVNEFDSITLPACSFTAPAGKQFKAWSINGTAYMPGTLYTPVGNTVIIAVWEDIPITAQIIRVSPTDSGVAATIYCAVDDATVLCALYDSTGRMTGIEVQSAKLGEEAYSFTVGVSNRIQVFVLDSSLRPLCGAMSACGPSISLPEDITVEIAR